MTDARAHERYLIIVTDDKSGGMKCVEVVSGDKLTQRVNYLSQKYEWRAISVWRHYRTLQNAKHPSMREMPAVRIDDTGRYSQTPRPPSDLIDTTPDGD